MTYRKVQAAFLSLALIVAGIYPFATPQIARAAAGPQIMFGGSASAMSGSFPYAATGFGPSVALTVGSVFPVAGTISNLSVNVDNVPGGVTTRTFTLQKNGANTAVTCTVTSAATTCTDSSHSFSVVAGDSLMMRDTNSGTPGGAHAGWSFVFTPTTTGDTALFAFPNGSGTGAVLYMSFPYIGAYGVQIVTPTTLPILIPSAGTIDNMQASTTNIGGTYLTSLLQGASPSTVATSSLQCTILNDHCSDTVNSVSVAAGDFITQTVYASSSVTGGFKGSVGVRFVPTNAGDFPIVAYNTNGADVAGATRYDPISGSLATTLPTVEASTTAPVTQAMTVTSMMLFRSTAPGAGKVATVTLRVNGADSSLVCTLTGTGSGNGITTKTCTGSVSLNAGDLINYSFALDAAGTTGTYRIGLLANANTANTAVTPSAVQINSTTVLNSTMAI